MDASYWAWAKDRARAIFQAPRARRRLDSSNGHRQLELLAREHALVPKVLVRRPPPDVEPVGGQWGLDEFGLPREVPAVVDWHQIERGLVAGIVSTTWPLAKRFSHFAPARLLAAVVPER